MSENFSISIGNTSRIVTNFVSFMLTCSLSLFMFKWIMKILEDLLQIILVLVEMVPE